MLQRGQILKDTYEIIGEIGSGGGGIVYKAKHLRLNKYVAVKLIKDEIKGAADSRAEADILKSLKSEYLPQVYDFANDGNDIYTVMEFIEGKTLYDMIVEKGKFSPKQTLVWAKQLASAAAYLHTRKTPVVHSDIKPQNIMITGEGKVCLIDFNISSLSDGGYYTVGSSDGYSPPEQYIAVTGNADTVQHIAKTQILAGEGGETEYITGTGKTRTAAPHMTTRAIIDTSSDVYSIGAVIYSCLTGCKPANSRKEITPLRKLCPNVPESLEIIVNKAMQKEKEKRFANGAELLKALEHINDLDARWRRQKLTHGLVLTAVITLFTASAAITYLGVQTLSEEKTDRFNESVAKLDLCVLNKDYSGFDEIMAPFEEEFYDSDKVKYFKAVRSYDEGDRESAFTESYKLLQSTQLSDTDKAQLSLICGEVAADNGDYATAEDLYRRAHSFDPASEKAVIGLAQSLVHLGRSDEALAAVENMPGTSYIEFVKGEIAFSTGDNDGALLHLLPIVNGETAAEDEIKRHAYMIAADAYRARYISGDKQSLDDCVSMLDKGILDLPAEMTMQLREDLIQCCIDAAEKYDSPEYAAKAVKMIELMKKDGISDYQSEMNLAVLLNRLGATDVAKKLFADMAADEDYKEHYLTIYIRLAMCEASMQGELEPERRNYYEFARFYNMAAEQYEEYTLRGNSDPEMERLKELYDELVGLGWIKQ